MSIPFSHLGDRLCALYYVRLSKLPLQFIEGGQVDVESHSKRSNEYFRHLILVSTFGSKTHSTAEEGLLASSKQGYVCIYAEICNSQVSIKAVRLSEQNYALSSSAAQEEKADSIDNAIKRTRSRETTAPKATLNPLLERVILSSFRLRGITRDCMSKKEYAELYSHVFRAAKFAVRSCSKQSQLPSLDRLQSVVDDLLNLFQGGG